MPLIFDDKSLQTKSLSTLLDLYYAKFNDIFPNITLMDSTDEMKVIVIDCLTSGKQFVEDNTNKVL